MAAINPGAYSASPDVEVEEPETTVHLDGKTRDELLLKLISRVERIDTEHELVVTAIQAHSSKFSALQHDQQIIISDVKNLTRNMGTVKKLLIDILTELRS